MKLGAFSRELQQCLIRLLSSSYFFFFLSFLFLGIGIWRELSVNFMPLFQSSDMQVDLNTSIISRHSCVLTVLPPAKSASTA